MNPKANPFTSDTLPKYFLASFGVTNLPHVVNGNLEFFKLSRTLDVQAIRHFKNYCQIVDLKVAGNGTSRFVV